MNQGLISQRSFCILSGLSGVAGVVLLIVSFAINNGPPPDRAAPSWSSSANSTLRPYFGELGCPRIDVRESQIEGLGTSGASCRAIAKEIKRWGLGCTAHRLGQRRSKNVCQAFPNGSPGVLYFQTNCQPNRCLLPRGSFPRRVVGYFDAPVLGHLANAKKKHITTLRSGIGIKTESQGLKPAFLKILQNGITKTPT
jgi:hypothetical protein